MRWLMGVHQPASVEVAAAPTIQQTPAQQTPAQQPSTQQPPAQGGRGERGRRGDGGLPPMNPIDENAPPPAARHAGKARRRAAVGCGGALQRHGHLAVDVARRRRRQNARSRSAKWSAAPATESIVSKPTYGSAQLHLEYNLPDMPAARADGTPSGQHKANSGVFLHGSYEIQILDSYNNLTKTYRGWHERVALPGCRAARERVPASWRMADLRHRSFTPPSVRTRSS